MTTDSIEDAVVSAARSKGYAINSTTMATVAIDLAGSKLDGELIAVPGKGSLSVQDYLRDLHDRAPSGFSRLQQPDKPDAERTITEMRRKRPLDAAWHARHARATGITKTMMDEIARNRA
ncbi:MULTISPECIES: hypothetical protein [unclassified Bradyrhizobium]|uniref:hypothetical protein n=1 Tax=unclassified Bradyrhizobium TaxID=2631580 RepID=UPI001FF19C01|nr:MULTISPECIES: hypothetical protein [unclassified Bradyrhizobium]MCJ9700151.1 hypothetical protein [Bradyrhizobium sp. SHOUNA76]MDA9542288.1 hypothetical protein [Bradyrhizobium sp. CCBAU 21362]